MAANKEKQNLRFKITSQRLNKKVRYDNFTKDEVKLIKAHKKFEQFEKELNDFWKTAPRKENNNVDWESMSERELDLFERINKEHDKALKQISKLEDSGIDSDKVMYMFMIINVHSASY
jgi:hypothetical protein